MELGAPTTPTKLAGTTTDDISDEELAAHATAYAFAHPNPVSITSFDIARALEAQLGRSFMGRRAILREALERVLESPVRASLPREPSVTSPPRSLSTAPTLPLTPTPASPSTVSQPPATRDATSASKAPSLPSQPPPASSTSSSSSSSLPSSPSRARGGGSPGRPPRVLAPAASVSSSPSRTPAPTPSPLAREVLVAARAAEPTAAAAAAPKAQAPSKPVEGQPRGAKRLREFASELPLVFQGTLNDTSKAATRRDDRALMLVQVDDTPMDFDGDSGAVGRLVATGNALLLDLKGHRFVGNIVPACTHLIVNVTGSVARVEGMMNDVVQLSHLSNVIDDLSGRVEGGSAEADFVGLEDADRGDEATAIGSFATPKSRGRGGGPASEGDSDDAQGRTSARRTGAGASRSRRGALGGGRAKGARSGSKTAKAGRGGGGGAKRSVPKKRGGASGGRGPRATAKRAPATKKAGASRGGERKTVKRKRDESDESDESDGLEFDDEEEDEEEEEEEEEEEDDDDSEFEEDD